MKIINVFLISLVLFTTFGDKALCIECEHKYCKMKDQDGNITCKDVSYTRYVVHLDGYCGDYLEGCPEGQCMDKDGNYCRVIEGDYFAFYTKKGLCLTPCPPGSCSIENNICKYIGTKKNDSPLYANEDQGKCLQACEEDSCYNDNYLCVSLGTSFIKDENGKCIDAPKLDEKPQTEEIIVKPKEEECFLQKSNKKSNKMK